MALKERRLINEIQTNNLPSYLARIEAKLGKAVPIEFDWANAEPLGEEAIWEVTFAASAIADGIEALCSEAFVCQEVAKHLERTVIEHSEAGDRAVTYADGVLTLRYNLKKTSTERFYDYQVREEVMNKM